MKNLIFFGILAFAVTTHATASDVQTCGYTEGKKLLEVIKSSARLRSMGQLDATVGMVKMMCAHDGINGDDATLRAGVMQAAKEVFAGTGLLERATRTPEQMANENLLGFLREKFSDAKLTLNDGSALKGETLKDDLLISGSVTLSNGNHCEVASQAPLQSTVNSICEVGFKCTKDSHVLIEDMQTNCAQFGL